MTRVEALHFIGRKEGDDPVDIEDRLDEILFEWRKEALEKIPIPFLMRKLDDKVEKGSEAWWALGLHITLPMIEENRILFDAEEILFLEHYERAISEAKRDIATCDHPDLLGRSIASAIAVQEQYMDIFPRIFASFIPFKGDVKAKDMIETGPLLRALKRGEMITKWQEKISKELKRIDVLKSL